MKRLILTPAILAVLVLLGGFPLAFATHSRPFNGSYSGKFAAISPTQAAITGTGIVEHLGTIKLTGITSVTPSDICKDGRATKENETFTSSNGDAVFSSATGVACPTSLGMFQLTAPFTITGGTGRFAHASGSGITQLSVVFTSMTTGTTSGTVTGVINY
jgi:hypothetical protein